LPEELDRSGRKQFEQMLRNFKHDFLPQDIAKIEEYQNRQANRRPQAPPNPQGASLEAAEPPDPPQASTGAASSPRTGKATPTAKASNEDDYLQPSDEDDFPFNEEHGFSDGDVVVGSGTLDDRSRDQPEVDPLEENQDPAPHQLQTAAFLASNGASRDDGFQDNNADDSSFAASDVVIELAAHQDPAPHQLEGMASPASNDADNGAGDFPDDEDDSSLSANGADEWEGSEYEYYDDLDHVADPTHLIHTEGGFDGALAHAKTSERLLLVNIQQDDLRSSMLNRDVWSNGTIGQLIETDFVFWQEVRALHAMPLESFARLESLPHSSLLFPHVRYD
jgi:hypothetical protein